MAFNLVRYSQQDPQWKNIKLGPGPDTIGYIGCALTSLAMYSSSWGFTETPATLNQKLTANGGITSDELLVWSAISKIYPQIQSTGLTICTNTDAPISQINTSLLVGQPVIVEVDYSPEAGLQTHWVLLYAQQGNDYLIQDPYPFPSETTPVTLMTRFSQGQPLQRAIKAVAWYTCSAVLAPSGTSSGSTTTTPSTSQPSTTQTGLYVQALTTVTAGLRLHTQPSSDSPANYAEMPGVPLEVIEDQTGALAKIGVTNQWINVADPSGHQGYVAAWYVQQVPGTAPASTSTSSSSTSSSTSIPSTSTSSTSTTSPATPSTSSSSTPSTSPSTTSSTPSTSSSSSTSSTPTKSTTSSSSQSPASQPQRLILKVIDAVGPNGLRLRAFPSLAGTLVGIEKTGAFLTVIEPPNSALSKVGIANQWINVRDPNGLRGYVMASYVAVA